MDNRQNKIFQMRNAAPGFLQKASAGKLNKTFVSAKSRNKEESRDGKK